MTVVTLEEPSTELTRWRDELRQRLGIKTITVGPGHDFAFVEMMNVLRRNEILAMLVDRPYAGTGTKVKFCERDTEFSTAPALLWQHTGAAVVPAFVLQESGGRYISFADAPLDFQPGTNSREALIENTQRLATHFEAIIRKHPEQWFNYVPIWKDMTNDSMTKHGLLRTCSRDIRIAHWPMLMAFPPPRNFRPPSPRRFSEKLQRHRAKFPSLTADFTEEKTTHLLNKPLIGNGTIAFQTPNKFRRELKGNNRA
jgi:hypothetical protein